MKKWMVGILGVLVVLLLILGIWLGPTLSRFLKVTVVDIDPQMKVFLGGGGNSIVLTSEDGKQALVVDTKIGPAAEQLKRYVDSLGKDVRVTVVNTHDHPDHTGGNKLFPQAVFIAGNYSNDEWKKMVGPRLPDEKIPVGGEKVMTVGSETVKIANLGQAHTSNDTVVYFVNRKMLHTGDLVFNHWNPVLRKDSNANVGKWIQVLETVINRYDATRLVPGHGPITDKSGLQAMHDYFADIYSAVGDSKKQARLHHKYADYYSLPGASGFDKTLKYIEAEKQGH
jgi:glyoxylase-like metal-dependent hydrolase (beta-lactamase superfamily II)